MKPHIIKFKGRYHCGMRGEHPIWWAEADTPALAYLLWKWSKQT